MRNSSGYVLLGKLITPVITFLVSVLIVRILSVNDFGIYNFVFAVMAYVGLFSSFGLPNIFKRYIPEFMHNREHRNVRKTVEYGLIIRLLMLLIALSGITLFAEPIGTLFKIDNYIQYFQIFAFGILFYLEAQLLGTALVSLFLHKYFVLTQICYTLIRGGLLFILLHRGYGLHTLLIVEVAGYALMFGFLMLFYWRKKPEIDQDKEKPEAVFPLKRLMRYGGFCYFNEVGEEVLDVRTDLFIITAFLGTHMMGLYAFATETVRLISRWMPHRLLMDVITPSFFSRYAQTRDVEDLNSMFNLVTKLITFFLFPLVMGMLLFGDKLIQYVYDPKYMEALVLLWIVVIFSAVNALAYPIGLVVEAVEHVEIHLYSKIFSIYNIIGDIVVIRPFGIVGVAVITGSAVLFKTIFTLVFVRKYVKLTIDWRSQIRILFNAAVMGVGLLLLRPLIHHLSGFIFATLAGGILFLLMSFFNKAFTHEERALINKITARPWFHF